MGAVLALISALAWGVADYIGGFASRRAGARPVLVAAYPAGAVVLSVFLLLIPGEYSTLALCWGIAAGGIGFASVVLLYVALSRGPMGVVSPITAVLSGAVPVAAGLLRGERLTGHAVAGILLAAVAVTLVSRQRGEHAAVRPSTLWLALAGGICIGLYLTALGTAPAESGIWTVTIARWVSTLMIAPAVLAVARQIPGQQFPWLLAVGCGVLDASANGAFQLAAQHGQLSIVAVLASLYPATTALLARLLLHERLGRVQLMGVLLALTAAALLALA